MTKASFNTATVTDLREEGKEKFTIVPEIRIKGMKCNKLIMDPCGEMDTDQRPRISNKFRQGWFNEQNAKPHVSSRTVYGLEDVLVLLVTKSEVNIESSFTLRGDGWYIFLLQIYESFQVKSTTFRNTGGKIVRKN